MLLNRALLTICGACTALGAQPALAQAVAPPTAVTPEESRRVTITYFKAKPGRLAALERYMRANAFAMDEIAVRQGLFVSYEWLDTGVDEGTWNALIMTTYRDAKGFAGIEHLWAPIKAAHKEVCPDGLAMKDLGVFVETKELFERAPFVNKLPTRPNN